MKRETEKVTSTAGLISTTTMENSPFLAVVENSSRKFAIKAALNGNIFMHCPVEMAEDFQVGFLFSIFIWNWLFVKLTRVGLIADWMRLFCFYYLSIWAAVAWNDCCLLLQVVFKRCRVRLHFDVGSETKENWLVAGFPIYVKRSRLMANLCWRMNAADATI